MENRISKVHFDKRKELSKTNIAKEVRGLKVKQEVQNEDGEISDEVKSVAAQNVQDYLKDELSGLNESQAEKVLKENGVIKNQLEERKTILKLLYEGVKKIFHKKDYYKIKEEEKRNNNNARL